MLPVCFVLITEIVRWKLGLLGRKTVIVQFVQVKRL